MTMKLYIFRGFETYTYQTHTAFIATSIASAEVLLNQLFDEVHSIAVKQSDIEEAIQEMFSNHEKEKRDLEKEIESLKDRIICPKATDQDVLQFHQQRSALIVKTREYQQNLNSLYQDLSAKASEMRITDYRPNAFGIYPESVKAEWVSESLLHLLELESDCIINDSVTDGD